MPWHQWLGTCMAAVAVALGVWRWVTGSDGGDGHRPGLAYLLLATLAVSGDGRGVMLDRAG